MLFFLDAIAGNGLHKTAHGLDHQRIAGGQYHASDDHTVVEHHARAFKAMRDVIGRLRDIEDEGLERLLLGVGGEIRAEVDPRAVELMASLTDRRGGFATGHITLQRGDDLNRGERLGASRLRRKIGADQFSRGGISAVSLYDRIDIKSLPEAGLAITNPPLGKVGLSEGLIEGELDHRARSFSATRKRQRGEVALELDLSQFTG